MQQLTRIAFTELKIDQSFVTNAARRQGVETLEDWNLLRQLGSQLAQGNFGHLEDHVSRLEFLAPDDLRHTLGEVHVDK